MRRRVVAIVVSLLGLVVLFVGPSAEAATVDAVGWWSRAATTDPLAESPVPLPPGPTTPDTAPIGATVSEGQLLVEGSADGAIAIAAATWTLADRESTPSLTLPISPGSSVTAASVILACKAAAPWTAPETRPGRWEAKPITDGRSCINGVIADDVSSVTFGMQPLLRRQLLDVVFVPGRVDGAPPEANGSTFRWVFDQPTADSLTLVEGSDFSEGDGAVVVTVPSRAAPLTEFPSSPGAGPSANGPVAFTSPPSPSGDTSAAIRPALEPQDLGPSVPRLESDLVAASTSTDGTARTLGIALLLVGGAIAAWAHYGDTAAVDATGPVMVGLGRFRRELTPEPLPVVRQSIPRQRAAPPIA